MKSKSHSRREAARIFSALMLASLLLSALAVSVTPAAEAQSAVTETPTDSATSSSSATETATATPAAQAQSGATATPTQVPMAQEGATETAPPTTTATAPTLQPATSLPTDASTSTVGSSSQDWVTPEEAIRDAIRRQRISPEQGYAYNLLSLTSSGEWAYGEVVRVDKVSGEIIPTQGALILAKRAPDGEWSARVPEDKQQYNAWLDQIPSDLLDDLVKDMSRWIPAPDFGAAATVSGHYLPWPSPIGAIVTQNYNTHGTGQIDFVPDTSDVFATKDGTIVYAIDSHPDWAHGGSQYASYNNVVVIRHSNSEYTLYLHLRQGRIPTWIKQGCPGGTSGQTCSLAVSRGSKIGEMGTTGWSSGDHLHLSTASSFYVDTNNADWADEDGDGNKSELTYTAFTTSHITADFVEYPYYSQGCETTKNCLQYWPWDANKKVYSQNAVAGGSLNPPTLISPSDGQTLNSRSVHFTWQSPNSTNQNGYTFKISASSNPNDLGNPDTGLGNQYTSYDVNLPSDGTFYWHMRTWNTSNQSSNWRTHRFVIDTSSQNPSTGNWHAEYFPNRDWSGAGRCAQNFSGPFINKDWGGGSPCSDIPTDNFTARFTGTMNFSPGNYVFHVRHDDGAKLGLNGRNILDNLNASDDNWACPANYISGDANLQLDYREDGGGASVSLEWTTDTSRCLSKADLVPYARDGASAPVIASLTTGNRNQDTLVAGEPAYFDWGYKNVGGSNAGAHHVKLSIDGQQYIDYPLNGLGADQPGGFDDWQIVYPNTGTHTVTLTVDANSEVDESNEGNNTWSGQFTWGSPPTFAGWKGEYFNNRDFSGGPSLIRDDYSLDLDWGTGPPGPGISDDNFSVRWTRTVNLPAGAYRFHLRHDDGARLYIDNALKIDAWSTCCVWDTADVSLTDGAHPFQVELREDGGASNITLWWERLSISGWRGEYYNN